MSAVEKIKLHYPLPIAKLHEEMRLETEPRLRTRKLVNLFEGTSQYLALVGLASYLHQKLFDPEVEQLRSDLVRPSLGHWVRLLKTLSKCLRPTDPQFLTANPGHDFKDEPIGAAVKVVRETVGLDSLKNVRLHHFLDTVLEFRNKKIGHGELSPIEADKIKEPLEAAINQWLSELSALYERHLLYISEVKLQKQHRVYIGTQLNTGISLESFQSEGEIDLDDNCVYLHLPTPNTYIPLSPFFVYDRGMQALYTYSDLSDQGEVRLRRLYIARGTQEWLTISTDKTLIVGSGPTLEPASPPASKTAEAFEPAMMSPKHTPEPTTETEDIRKDRFDETVLAADVSGMTKGQAFGEKELIRRKRDGLQKTWDSLQERIDGLREDWTHDTRREERERISGEIKKAENLQAEIEPQLNELISKLEKIEEAHSQRDLQKTKHQTDVEQSSEGLSALSRMMQDPRVLAVMVRSRDNFEGACRQIDIMRDYKSIHDALHELEFKCFKEIFHEVARFPHKSNFGDLSFYLLVLSQVKNRIQGIVAKGSIPQSEGALPDRLSEAERTLTQALETRDRKLFKEVVRRIRHVLSYDLARINQRLCNAAAALSLPDLIKGMEQVRGHLIHYEIDTVEVQTIDKGIQSLQNLNHNLTTGTRKHSSWQEINDELRLAESDLQLAIDQWPHNKERLDSLCGDSIETLEGQIRELCKDLDKAIEAKDAKKKLQERFRSCNRLVGLRFQEIDGYLKDLCDQVKKLDEPITSIVRQMI